MKFCPECSAKIIGGRYCSECAFDLSRYVLLPSESEKGQQGTKDIASEISELGNAFALAVKQKQLELEALQKPELERLEKERGMDNNFW